MKFNKVTVNNFRQYIGENSVEFCHSEDKNVTLIFGENGFGKTGIFRAIMFALYGLRYLKQDNLTKEEQREGLVLVNEKLLENNSGNEIEAYVVLDFENNDKKYSLKRIISARKLDNRIMQEPKGVSLTITEDFNTRSPIMDATEIDGIIASIINEKIKDFFLFDGEQIEELTKYSKESKEEIKSGIRTLLNLDAIEISQEALKKKIREKEKEIEINSSGELELISEKLSKKNTELQTLEEEISNTEKNLNEAEKAEKDIRKKIDENKGILEKQKDRNTIKEKINEAKNNIGELKQKIKETLTISGPYVAYPLIMELYNDLDAKLEKGEIPNNIRKEFIDKLLKQCRCICGNNLNEHPEAREFLLEYQRNHSDENSEIALKIYRTLGDLKGKINLATRDIDKLLNNYNKNQEEISNLSKKLEIYDEDLKGEIPDLGISLDRIKKDVSRLQKELGQKEEQLSRLTSEINKLSGEQEKLSENDIKCKKLNEQKKILVAAGSEFAKIYNEYSDELRLNLSNCATEIFKKIASKTTLNSLAQIVILEDFQLEVLSTNGTRMLSEISAGEKAVVSLSYICSLLQVGSNLEMPLLMDTPFGRLSGAPRDACLKNLPNLLSQWILLTTDTEFQTEEASVLRESGKWDKVYEISHVADRESIIEEKDINNWVPIRSKVTKEVQNAYTRN